MCHKTLVRGILDAPKVRRERATTGRPYGVLPNMGQERADDIRPYGWL